MSDKFFKENPHPLVEDHYHIQELINAQQKRAEARTQWRERKKREEELDKNLASYKDIELLDFWCDHCKIDFVARSKKQLDGWSKIAYYKIKHRKCGMWCIRLITERFMDAYFFRSKKVAYDRMANATEMIQPFQSGFNLMYGKK